MMKLAQLPLEKPRNFNSQKLWGRNQFPWRTCAPFVQNSRGLLIHRPRSVSTYTIFKEPHIAVHYWCGNIVVGGKKLTFLDTLNQDMLLCERCEAIAVSVGLPTTDSIVGRHIHRGKVVAVQTCHTKGA